MTRMPRPVAVRAIATFAAAAGAFIALAQPSDARMLRDDCFTQIIAACNQIRNVDAAHQCVIHETNSCQQLEARPRAQSIDWRGRPTTHVSLHTLYGGGDAGGAGAPGGGPNAGGQPGGRP